MQSTPQKMKADRFSQARALYFKEWAADHLQRAPVGPGYYETLNLPRSDQVLQKKTSKKFSFPKFNRGLIQNN
jgi:hypothetical protein